MKIGIDARCLMEGARTGVEEYTIGFIKKILKEGNDHEIVLFFNSFKKIRGNISWLEKYENVEIRNFGFPNKMLNFSMWFFGWPKIDVMLGGVDVFFAPNILFISLSKKCHFVLTVHDLSFERFSEHFSLKRRLWHFLLNPRKLCRRANKLLPISHSTKNDLVALYGISKHKMKVLPPFVKIGYFLQSDFSSEKIERVRKKYNLPKDFILYLGTIEPRKNILSIVRSFEALKKHERIPQNLKLVIAGLLGWSYESIIEAIQDSEFEKDIMRIGFVNEKDKAVLYRLAKIFVYPSFFEGYGFPPVEAMSCGTPVVTSNCSSLPEVVDDAAILVDPYRPFELLLAMELLLSDEKVYNVYKEKGIARARALYKAMRNKKLINLLR